jgi:3-methyladenine DNA glycosylase AlkD
MTLSEIRTRLRALADPARVPILQSFFKTAPGEYAEGDQFIGISVPQLRRLCRECRGADMAEIDLLLRSPIHEERLFALLLLVDAFTRGGESERRAVYAFYLSHTAGINNWDLVDASAEAILGGWLRHRSRAPLTRLARSSSLWERRIAVVATLHFIRQGEVDETLRVVDLVMGDRHDLIHKAAGWMLREAGKRDRAALRRYLAGRYERMPRTMLRYAIERLPETERRRYLTGRLQPVSSGTRSAGRSTTRSSSSKSSGRKVKPKP